MRMMAQAVRKKEILAVDKSWLSPPPNEHDSKTKNVLTVMITTISVGSGVVGIGIGCKRMKRRLNHAANEEFRRILSFVTEKRAN